MSQPEEVRFPTVSEKVEASIRISGRALILASLYPDLETEGLSIEIAKLTAGQDPDAIDSSSPDFRAGAALALSTALNAMHEMPPRCYGPQQAQ